MAAVGRGESGKIVFDNTAVLAQIRAGITVSDVNLDGIPDLVVANRGSNDVSILYGTGTGASWTMKYGPRLQSNGTGPVSTLVKDVTGDGIPDILVSNSQSSIRPEDRTISGARHAPRQVMIAVRQNRRRPARVACAWAMPRPDGQELERRNGP